MYPIILNELSTMEALSSGQSAIHRRNKPQMKVCYYHELSTVEIQIFVKISLKLADFYLLI